MYSTISKFNLRSRNVRLYQRQKGRTGTSFPAPSRYLAAAFLSLSAAGVIAIFLFASGAPKSQLTQPSSIPERSLPPIPNSFSRYPIELQIDANLMQPTVSISRHANPKSAHKRLTVSPQITAVVTTPAVGALEAPPSLDSPYVKTVNTIPVQEKLSIPEYRNRQNLTRRMLGVLAKPFKYLSQ